jgi:hypothetical protein
MERFTHAPVPGLRPEPQKQRTAFLTIPLNRTSVRASVPSGCRRHVATPTRVLLSCAIVLSVVTFRIELIMRLIMAFVRKCAQLSSSLPMPQNIPFLIRCSPVVNILLVLESGIGNKSRGAELVCCPIYLFIVLI